MPIARESPARRRIPRGLVGALALVLGGELFVVRHELDIAATVTSREWRATGRAARREAARCGVLCFGDSLVKVGIAPGWLGPRLGKRAYNLAISGGQSPSSYFALRRALAAGARPSAVLVDFKWSALANSYRLDMRLLPELVGPREFLDLAWAARDAGMFGRMMLSAMLPSVGARDEIRANLREALRGGSTSIRKALPPWRRNWRRNDGAHLIPKAPSLRQATDFTDRKIFPDRWTIDPTNAIYVERFLGLAASRRIPVFWLMMPLSPEVQARREEMGADGPYTEFARAMQARFRNVVVIDGRHSRYAWSAFVDPTHLNREGAARLTADVAAIIRQHLDSGAMGSRWLELPTYREPPIDVPLEDVNQSRLALEQAEGRRPR